MAEFKPDKRQHINQFQTGGWKAHWILIICSLLYLVNYMDRSTIPVVQEMIKHEMKLTDTELGMIQTVFLLSTGMLAFPLGFLIDRWSRNKAMGVFGIIWSFVMAASGLAVNFVTLIIPRVLVGIGKAGFGPGGTAIITAAYPRNRQGLTLGIFNLSMALGMALGTLLTGYIASRLGWRAPFIIFAAAGVVLALLAFSMRDYSTHTQSIAGNLKGLFISAWEVIKMPTMRWLIPGYGLFNFTIQAQIAWMPTFFIRQFHWDTSQAGNWVSIMNLAGAIGAPVGGILADAWDRRDRRGRLLLAAIMSAASALAMMVSTYFFPINFAIGFFLGFLVGFFYMIASVSLATATQNAVPPAHKGLTYGLTLFSMYILGGAWSPMVGGAISDALGGDAQALLWSLIILCAGSLLGCICFTISSRYYNADEDKSRQYEISAI